MKLTFDTKDLVERPQDVRSDVSAARKALNDQPIILDKLKRAKRVVGLIRSVLEVVGDVRQLLRTTVESADRRCRCTLRPDYVPPL